MERVAAKFGGDGAVLNGPLRLGGRTLVLTDRLQIRRKQSVLRTDQVLGVGKSLWIAVIAAVDPKVRRRAAAFTAIEDERFAVITGIHRPGQNQLLLVIDTLNANGGG